MTVERQQALRLCEADRCKAMQVVSSGKAQPASCADIVQSNDCGNACW